VSAQRSGRTGDPTLNKGEGLERTRNDLDKMRNQNQDKNARQLNLYMFGASFSLLDSVLYISEISEVDDVTVNNKWFIKDRSSFESQFTDRVKTDNDDSMLTSVYFSEKEKKVAKRRSRLVKRNAKKNKFLLIKVSDFTFSRPSENN
jgi:hypothetical protein